MPGSTLQVAREHTSGCPQAQPGITMHIWDRSAVAREHTLGCPGAHSGTIIWDQVAREHTLGCPGARSDTIWDQVVQEHANSAQNVYLMGS